MKLYKDGKETLIEKDQLSLMLEAGWSFSEEVLETSEQIEPEKIEGVVEEKITVAPALKKAAPKKATPAKKKTPLKKAPAKKAAPKKITSKKG